MSARPLDTMTRDQIAEPLGGAVVGDLATWMLSSEFDRQRMTQQLSDLRKAGIGV